MKALAQKALDYLQGKKVSPEFTNVHHADFIGMCEPAFKVGNVQYYRFCKETSMPWGRYMFLQTFLHAQELRIDMDLLKGYIQLMKKAVNGNAKIGIDLITVMKVITQLESRCELEFEVETTYRLASVMYFDQNEDLYHYDKAYNDNKIATWKEAKVVDFFYTRPMDELLGLSSSSPEDLRRFIDQQTELLNELTIEMPAQ